MVALVECLVFEIQISQRNLPLYVPCPPLLEIYDLDSAINLTDSEFQLAKCL